MRSKHSQGWGIESFAEDKVQSVFKEEDGLGLQRWDVFAVGCC